MLTRTLLKTGLRDLVRRPLQSGLMILGVALGVAVVIAIDLANTSARRAFDLSAEAVTGSTTHQIIGGPSGLPDELYRQVRVDWGFRASAPVVEGVGLALDLDQQPLRILGVDPIADPPFRRYLAGGSAQLAGFARFFTDPDAVLIGVGLADRYGLRLGDRLRVQVNDRIANLKVTGILTPADANSRRALDGLLLMDVGNAQKLFRLEGQLTRIDLMLTDVEAARLGKLLPRDARLAPASEQSNTVAQLTDAFQLNLTALSLLALVVGMFLIYNTMMFSVVQRRAVLGTMRALGVTAEQLFALIVLEAAVASAIGAGLGLGLGWLLGQGAVRLVTQTINDLYYVVSVREAALTPFTVLKGAGLGLLAGIVSAAAPAWEAAGVVPITAMRPSTLESRTRAWLPWLALGGIALNAAGVAVLLLITESIPASFAGLLLIVLGLALLVPGATVLLMRAATVGLGPLFGVLGRMAARTVVKALSRTSVAIAALMVAVSVTIGVSVMIASFRSTVINWLGLTLTADVYLSAPSAGGVSTTVTLHPDVAARAARLPGVAAVASIRRVSVDSEFGPIQLTVTDDTQERSASLYRFARGTPAEIIREMEAGAVIVSEPFANRHHLPPTGATITLRTDQGERTFPVIAVYYDYASDRGAVLMRADVYHRYWNDRGLTGVGVYLAEGQEAGAAAYALRSELRGTAIQVQVNRELRESALKIFDRTFAITNALRILAVVVAFIGVLSALMALQVERTRELATLLALGLTPPQLWRLTLLETGLMGLTAGLLSLPTGYILALVLIYVINLRSFGWTITMTLDPAVFAQALAVSVAAALLAAIYPLLRLQQMPVAAALRQE